MAIEKDTRRIILDDLILIGDVFGNSTANDFAERVYASEKFFSDEGRNSRAF